MQKKTKCPVCNSESKHQLDFENLVLYSCVVNIANSLNDTSVSSKSKDIVIGIDNSVEGNISSVNSLV